ncbi:dehydrogenase/reductase SDR family member 7 isoform X2 [Anthonomus grandis grandis]|uniref:dehydrogenase/reductase SDR family member 7 isoform X2 n=1 Tax=Anthonomus grandis grandis TaxID=2921223 RepID=UPI0021653015|nr:dehydrogenase/reductase SDR family member 7 isoform X2 [Anthonomus grandis grandis]
MLFFGIIGFGVFLYGCFYTLASVIFDCDVRLGFLDKFGKSPRRLKGKVAFITGASSGIGEHTAYALAKAGVKLVLTARRSLELQRVKQQCIVVSNGQLEEKDILVIPMDVLDLSSHKTHFQHAIRHFGHVDILINNAGRSQRANWENIDITVDRQMFELNVFAVVNLSRVALEHFNKRGQGHLAVVSSLAGILGAPFSGSYTGAKHAIHGYFNGLRAEKLGTQIHVTLLCPGPTFTNFLAEAFTDKDGEKHHGSTKPTDKRMTAERCGHLNAVAIVNKVGEAWMGLFPLMPMVYVSIYFPNLGMRILGPQYLYKLRDSKEYTGFTEMSKTE